MTVARSITSNNSAVELQNDHLPQDASVPLIGLRMDQQQHLQRFGVPCIEANLRRRLVTILVPTGPQRELRIAGRNPQHQLRVSGAVAVVVGWRLLVAVFLALKGPKVHRDEALVKAWPFPFFGEVHKECW